MEQETLNYALRCQSEAGQCGDFEEVYTKLRISWCYNIPSNPVKSIWMKRRCRQSNVAEIAAISQIMRTVSGGTMLCNMRGENWECIPTRLVWCYPCCRANILVLNHKTCLCFRGIRHIQGYRRSFLRFGVHWVTLSIVNS